MDSESCKKCAAPPPPPPDHTIINHIPSSNSPPNKRRPPPQSPPRPSESITTAFTSASTLMTYVDFGDDVLAGWSIDDETFDELMKLLEPVPTTTTTTTMAPPPPPIKGKLVSSPYNYSAPLIYDPAYSSSNYVTINGNEESCGSSFSDSDSSLMASIDMHTFGSAIPLSLPPSLAGALGFDWWRGSTSGGFLWSEEHVEVAAGGWALLDRGCLSAGGGGCGDGSECWDWDEVMLADSDFIDSGDC
ncbi:hypothetical protein Dimus_027452 [Dionaea muscipula]